MERIRVGHDSRGSGKGIFLDEIEVAPDYESSIFFPCSCWLAEDIGDGRLQREIYPGTRTPRTSGNVDCKIREICLPRTSNRWRSRDKSLVSRVRFMTRFST